MRGRVRGTLRKSVVGRNPEVRASVGSVVMGVAPTAAEAMIAAIANARIPDPPIGRVTARRRRGQSDRLVL